MIEKINNAPINYEDWLDLGRIIIPCLKGKPVVSNWSSSDFKITKEEWRTNYTHCEIALRLDQDIDLDVDNDLVKRFITNHIKSCDAVSGRRGNPSSHYWWRGKASFKQFILPNELQKYCEGFPHGLTLCEIRHESKRYTIVPESKHSKANETVRWETYQGINEYSGNLSIDVGKIALATALCITYASSGQRDAYCTAIAGTLLKHTEWTEKEIDEFVYDIAIAANDDEVDKRKSKGTSSKKAKRKFGMPKLAEIVGCSTKTISTLFSWIGVREATSEDAKEAIGEIIEYGYDRYIVKINAIVQGVLVEKEIWVDGPTLMNQKLFYDEIIRQAGVWVPKIKPAKFEEIMMLKYEARTKSKDYVEEANEDLVFKKYFSQYITKEQAFSDKINLLEYKRPHFDMTKKFLEFNLDSFEDFLVEKRVKIKRVDLVRKVQKILNAKKNHGKVDGKSCVSWKIQKYEIDKNDLVIDGVYEEINQPKQIEGEKDEG